MSFEPKINSEIAGRYKLLILLGKGAKGSVFKASDSTMSRTVAIKLHESKPSKKDIVRFQLEAKALAKLKHPNIVQVSDFGLHQDESCYLVMEFLPGKNLTYLIKNEFAQLRSISISVLMQICSAMKHAHEKGVYHRDLKPANIIIQEPGSSNPMAKIVDFGLAKLSKDSYITDEGTGVGTPPYMSPEQVQGNSTDARSDIYSFGCLMYELLTGVVAFQGNTALETSKLHINAPAPKLSDTVSVSDEVFDPLLEEIVARCLAKSPDDRYQNFDEIILDFEKFESQAQDIKKESVVASTRKLSLSKVSFAILAVTGIFIVSIQVYNLFFSRVEHSSARKIPLPVKDLENTIDYDKDSRLTDDICHRPSVTQDGLIKLRREIGKRKIKNLTLNLSQFDGSGLSHYIDLPLTRLSIANSELTDKGLYQISKMKGLVILKLNKNINLTYKGLAYLSKLPRLREINLISSKLDDKAMHEIAMYPALSTLVVTDNPAITNKGWGYLKKLGTLAVLELGQQILTEKDLQALESLKRLRVLRLQQVKGLSPSRLTKLKKNMTRTTVMTSEYDRNDLVDYENLLPLDPDTY